jgi:hypothetical protein
LATSCPWYEMVVGEGTLPSLAQPTSSKVTRRCLVLHSSSMILGFLLRSFFKPTRMMGSPWQKWFTSLIHCNNRKINISTEVLRSLLRTLSWTLSREPGLEMSKHIRITCESGYARGRMRSEDAPVSHNTNSTCFPSTSMSAT